MAPPPPPLDLIADVAIEIFLRFPPDEPEHLFRAAFVCKHWLRVLCDPIFRRRYRAFHGAPPLLGLLHRRQLRHGDPAARFASTTSMPDFPHPGSGGRRTRPLDCRHGRVLVHMLEKEDVDLLVWDPVTGDRHAFPQPDMELLIYAAAVFCAVEGCDHLDCHGDPFGVVFVATDEHDEIIKASVYSSETGAWSVPVSLDNGSEFYAKHRQDAIEDELYYIPYVQPRRAAIIRDDIYFTLRRDNAIIKYDRGHNCLSMIDPPSPNVGNSRISLMVMEDSSLGFACTEGFSLFLWSRKVNSEGAPEWVQIRVLELEATIPIDNVDYVMPETTMSIDHLEFGRSVVGFAEGVDVIFISTDVGLFTIEIKSGKVKKVDKPGVYYSVLPYMSFCTPDRGKLLSIARTP
ncbi:unnamed protein product [Urochloa decumbens]|uniref:F-box domain-containing protein n=1 Tax=Urochloa decumbens TaxID=240449 RepID=A0ABC9F1W7_9POAL